MENNLWALLHNSAACVYIQQRTASYILSVRFFSLHSACGDLSPVARVLCHRPRVQAMAGVGFAAFTLHSQWLHQYSSLCKHKLSCCSDSLHIIHIDSALLMIKYNVLQSLRLTGKLDWIYLFEVGWVVFSYVVGLFFFFFTHGTSCHFANEELPTCLLIKTSISEGFTCSCLIR